ncbi:MAG: hypothetical protein EXR86_16235 [Gammaproteobacteria bacterium]|nr:hypothetical protein [Gammaproteobacteria bacterium]
MNNERRVSQQSSMAPLVLTAVFAFGILGGGTAMGGTDDVAPPGRSIAYAFTEIIWGVYETKDAKEECPQGLVELGPREEYKLQFPDDGTKRKIIDSSSRARRIFGGRRRRLISFLSVKPVERSQLV